MPMNHRLMVPRQTTHPEALAWRAAVVANGGSVSGTTLNAVSNWFKAIASVRSLVYRANAFAAPTLAGVVVPLIRGPVFGGTTYGNTTDTNVNFVSGDVSLAGGVNAAGNATKYLNTGFPTNTLAAASRHLGFMELSYPNRTFDRCLGSESAGGAGQQAWSLGYGSSATGLEYYSAATLASSASVSPNTTGGFLLGNSSSSTASEIYKSGVAGTAGTPTAATPTNSEVFVFALNRASTSAATDYYGGVGGGYSIGLSMTAAQALVYSNAWLTLTAALGRTIS